MSLSMCLSQEQQWNVAAVPVLNLSRGEKAKSAEKLNGSLDCK